MFSRFSSMLFAFVILNIFRHLCVKADIILSKVDRTIDLTSQVAKISSQITVENKGNDAVKDFILAVEADQLSHLSYLEVTVS